MKYRFYAVNDQLEEKTLSTRKGNTPLSTIARTLRDMAFKRFGPEGYIVPDGSLVGGYYRNEAGDTLAVVFDWRVN